jgi:Zn-dependent protease
MICVRCSSEIAPGLLVCPTCQSLVHADDLKALANQAEGETASGNITKALEHWRRALELLPAGSVQHSAITQKINQLVQRLDATEVSPSATQKPKWANAAGALGVVGLLAWKFKFLVVFLLTKAKLLLVGLTSMLLSFGVYWTAWGWQFAAGLVLSIYVHEMGHVYRLSRYGIKASIPMFIPGLGAVIRQKQYPASPHEDARVGLAGPIWGLGAGFAAYLIHLATQNELFAAIAKFGAWINLFNLLPVWQLDGGRGFRALTKSHRIIIAAIIVGMWFYTSEGLLILLFIAAAFRVFQKDAPTDPDNLVLIEFASLIITLSMLAKIAVHAP